MARKTFFCIDAHTCGNPVRLIAGGGPILKGASIAEKRREFMAEFDWIRRGLMFEPRGHDMMSGSLLYPPSDPNNDIAVLFIETSGCLPMCGHGLIGTVTIALEQQLIRPRVQGELRVETPAGLVKVKYDQQGNKVKSVKLTNVASFLAGEGYTVECPELGELSIDVAYGGNFYGIIDPQKNFAGIENYTADKLISWSRDIRERMNEKYTFQHPDDPGIQGMSHLLWTGRPLKSTSTARNAVFYGDKAIDRSPCGTGTSARMAQWYTKGLLKPGDEFVHESYIGSIFKGTIEAETKIGNRPAIQPGIEGWAMVTGFNTIFLDDEDPYVHGFQVI